MIIFKIASSVDKKLRDAAQRGLKTGFVPTMGALHEGHLSLIRASLRSTDLTVCSIFVNPTQFNDKKDFDKYPVTIPEDIALLESAGCSLLFLPATREIYPAGTGQLPHYELGYLETLLEGKYRPGHFQGVCQVMDRLLTIVKPDQLFLGQKDYQQCMVIEKMMRETGHDRRTHINICTTLREPNGLAMSSRNRRLSDRDREQAGAIHEALQQIKKSLTPGKLDDLVQKGVRKMEEQGLKPDYLQIADAKTLESVREWNGEQELVALTAAFMGEVRLIDNLLLT